MSLTAFRGLTGAEKDRRIAKVVGRVTKKLELVSRNEEIMKAMLNLDFEAEEVATLLGVDEEVVRGVTLAHAWDIIEFSEQKEKEMSLIGNPFMSKVQEAPGWAHTKTSVGKKYGDLLDCIKAIENKAVVLTNVEFQSEFPAKCAASSIKSFCKERGWHVRIVFNGDHVSIVGRALSQTESGK